jgi:hypothetical protein
MALIDMTQGQGANTLRGPGDYDAEVLEAEEKISSKGDAMFVVKFKSIADGRYLCQDIVMLGGGGVGMGLAKLRALGFDKDFKGDVSAAELIGKRLTLHLKEEEFKGTVSLKPDIKQGEYCGYTPLEAGGEDKAAQDFDVDPFSEPGPTEKLDSENIPF